MCLFVLRYCINSIGSGTARYVVIVPLPRFRHVKTKTDISVPKETGDTIRQWRISPVDLNNSNNNNEKLNPFKVLFVIDKQELAYQRTYFVFDRNSFFGKETTKRSVHEATG
ncbi:hypothetical protein GWI33_009143 [Rhynchophorus ferrugineus]|uniref:Uncharacterized protein n=1 Tax=Rhynchophorus ferrugineus TaxID=354439 RepID=A0A834MGT6_RHYFE|nr:hypothetical protein GWI33_009143 [Rhynchophorus ferrugineus]